MQVKLLNPGLIGDVNREAGEVIDVEESLARDIAARGDGELVVDPDAQVIPAYGAVALPTTTLDAAEPAKTQDPEKPGKGQKLGPGDAK